MLSIDEEIVFFGNMNNCCSSQATTFLPTSLDMKLTLGNGQCSICENYFDHKLFIGLKIYAHKIDAFQKLPVVLICQTHRLPNTPQMPMQKIDHMPTQQKYLVASLFFQLGKNLSVVSHRTLKQIEPCIEKLVYQNVPVNQLTLQKANQSSQNQNNMKPKQPRNKENPASYPPENLAGRGGLQ